MLDAKFFFSYLKTIRTLFNRRHQFLLSNFALLWLYFGEKIMQFAQKGPRWGVKDVFSCSELCGWASGLKNSLRITWYLFAVKFFWTPCKFLTNLNLLLKEMFLQQAWHDSIWHVLYLRARPSIISTTKHRSLQQLLLIIIKSAYKPSLSTSSPKMLYRCRNAIFVHPKYVSIRQHPSTSSSHGGMNSMTTWHFSHHMEAQLRNSLIRRLLSSSTKNFQCIWKVTLNEWMISTSMILNWTNSTRYWNVSNFLMRLSWQSQNPSGRHQRKRRNLLERSRTIMKLIHCHLLILQKEILYAPWSYGSFYRWLSRANLTLCMFFCSFDVVEFKNNHKSDNSLCVLLGLFLPLSFALKFLLFLWSTKQFLL